MHFDDGPGDRQSQTHAVLFRREKGIEDARQLVPGNPVPCIAHRNKQGPFALTCSMNYDAPLRVRCVVYRVHRIEQKVEENLLEVDTITADGS